MHFAWQLVNIYQCSHQNENTFKFFFIFTFHYTFTYLLNLFYLCFTMCTLRCIVLLSQKFICSCHFHYLVIRIKMSGGIVCFVLTAVAIQQSLITWFLVKQKRLYLCIDTCINPHVTRISITRHASLCVFLAIKCICKFFGNNT